MSIQYPKKERGGTSPVGPVVPHIFRDPPAAIFTRKHEMVDIGDVMYMARPDGQGDATRFNEGVKYFARGVNPMVAIDYGNHSAGGVNTSLHNGMASSPFKIEVVRPPLFPIETLVPISAPRIHQNYSISTNPRIEPVNISAGIDRGQIKNAIIEDIGAGGTIHVNPGLEYYQMNEQYLDKKLKIRDENITLRGTMRPTSSYALDNSRDINNLRKTAVQNTNVYTVSSNISGDNIISMREILASGTIQNTLNGNATSNVGGTQNISNIWLTDFLSSGKTQNTLQGNATSNVGGTKNISNMPITEKFASGNIQKTLDGVSNTNVSSNLLVNNMGITNNVSVNALQDLHNYSITSNANFGNIVVFDPKTNSSLDLKSTVQDKNYISVQAALGKPLTFHTNNGVAIQVKDYSYSVVNSGIGNSQFVIQINQPDIVLDRNMPLYTASANASNQYNDYGNSMIRANQDQYNLEKQASFGSYNDRITMADPNIRN